MNRDTRDTLFVFVFNTEAAKLVEDLSACHVFIQTTENENKVLKPCHEMQKLT